MTDASIWALWILCGLEFIAAMSCSYAAADTGKTWPQIVIKIAMTVVWFGACIRLLVPLVQGLDPTVSWFGVSVFSTLATLTVIEVALNGVYRMRKFGRRVGDRR